MKRVLHEIREFLAIVLLCVLVAVGYGLIHDQITIRICPGYFTEWHERIIPSDDLSLIALAWGVVATWWMGAILGVLVALCSRLGRRNQLNWKELLKPVLRTIAVTGVAAAVAGWTTYTNPNASSGVEPPGYVDEHAFYTCLSIHSTSYKFGAAASVALCFWIARKRLRSLPATGAGLNP